MIIDDAINSWLVMFGVSFICGIFIASCYVYHGSFTSYTKSFAFTLLIVVVLMAAILNSVGTNIAASISLFGALSLLRFRSVVKSTDDMGFLLAAVTIGLVVGTRNYLLLPPILLIIGALVVLYKFLRVKRSSETQTFVIYYVGELHSDYIINILNASGFKNVCIQSKSIKVSSKQKVLKVCCSGSPSDSIPAIESLSEIDAVTKVRVVTNEPI